MAMPHRVAPQWTLAELHRLPEDGNRYELVDGALFVTPPPSLEHQQLIEVLAAQLQPYVTTQRLGRISFPRSVVRFGRRSEVEPDLMVRPLPARPTRSWAGLPLPILVVEAISGATRRRDLVDKRALYRTRKVPTYWIIDREERAIHVVCPDRDDVTESTGLVWHPAGASRAFALDVADYFREALGR